MKKLTEAGKGTAAALGVLLFAASVQPRLALAARVYPSAGTTSAAFLKLGAGARATALAGAFTGVPGDPFALYWNPAGLAYPGPYRNVAFFHNEYFQGLGQEYLAYTAPSRAGAWGLSLNYFYTAKDMERRSGLNEADPLNPVSPSEGKFGAYDVAASAGYGFRAGGGLALGASAKVIRQSIAGESGASAALDIGLLRAFSWRGGDYTAGLAVQNLGPGVKFNERRYALPLSFRAGLSRALDAGGLVTLEADKPVDNYPSFALGAEYPLTGRLALRSGYRWRLYGNELGAWSGFSAGAGVVFDRLTFDYAFTPFGVLGNSHRFSLILRFGADGQRDVEASRRAATPPDGYANFLFASSARPLVISSRGIKYQVRAASADCGISSMTFKTMLRGEAAAEFSVAEGVVTGEALAGFPPGVLPLKSWKPAALPGNVQGDINFTLKVRKQLAASGRPVFLYRAGGAWREVPAEPAGEDGEYLYFSASAPFSTDYGLGLKVGEGN